jgi:HEAT repeat protein
MLAAFLILLAGGIAWLLLQPGEPVYEGRSLSSWLEDYNPNVLLDPRKHDKADEAMRHIGTNGIPTLLRMLRASDSDMKYKLSEWASRQHLVKFRRIYATDLYSEALVGFEILGPKAKDAVPSLIEIYEKNHSPHLQKNVVLLALIQIGPGAAEAVPMLAKQTNNPNSIERKNAAFALCQIHATSDHMAVIALIQFLHDSDPLVRETAANALWHFSDTEDAWAISTMVELLKDPDKLVRENAARLIRRLDPETAIKEGIN